MISTNHVPFSLSKEVKPMNAALLEKLSAITDEERRILRGETQIDRSIYMDGSRDVISGDKLLEPGKIITIRPHTRFAVFPEHSHDYVEMVYMCRGQTTHRINGTELVLHEGDLLMLGQHARQSIAPGGRGRRSCELYRASGLLFRYAVLSG